MLDGRGSVVVLRVLKHHLHRGDEAFLGVRGVGVVDEQVRKEFDLGVRGESDVAVLERPSVRRPRGTAFHQDLKSRKK